MANFPAYNLEAYKKLLSLWKLVEEIVSPGERPDIRDILGDSLIEQSLELHDEVDNLLSIWQDYRAETEQDLSPRVYQALPEPPGMRENLRCHIRMLLESVREKAKEEGRDAEVYLSRHNSDVLDYVTDDLSRNASPTVQRPGSARSSRDGRETPMRMTPSADGDGMSGTSTVSDQVDSVKEQLNILRIDEVANQLRVTLEEEVSQLLKDSQFLQECLEEESEFRSQSGMSSCSREPSLQELREERSRLAKEIEVPAQAPIGIMDSVKVRNPSLPNSPKKLPGPLTPSSRGSAKLCPSPPSSAGIGRTAPLRASHKTGHSSPTGLPTSKSRKFSGDGAQLSLKTDVDSHQKSHVHVAVMRGPESPTRLQPSPPSSARPPVGRTSSSRFRHRVVETKQSSR